MHQGIANVEDGTHLLPNIGLYEWCVAAILRLNSLPRLLWHHREQYFAAHCSLQHNRHHTTLKRWKCALQTVASRPHGGALHLKNRHYRQYDRHCRNHHTFDLVQRNDIDSQHARRRTSFKLYGKQNDTATLQSTDSNCLTSYFILSHSLSMLSSVSLPSLDIKARPVIASSFPL